MSLLKYPYTNLHEINLDWLIEKLNDPNGPVRTVNGMSGFVTLTGEDIARSNNNPETVSAALTTQGQSIQTVRNQIGITPLPTVAQTLTGAIAENAQEIADVEDNVIGSTALPTTAQTLTGAIAENASNIGGNANSITSINNKIGSTALPTTAQTLTGAITENANNIVSLNNQMLIQGIALADFNTLTGDVTRVKWYNGSTFVGCSNIPSACDGQAWPFVLEVIKMGTYTKQILHCFAIASQANTSPTYVRQQTYSSGSIIWADWSVK